MLYLLAAAGALLAASGFVLRPRLIDRVERASSRLLDAAVESLDQSRSFGGEPCPACGRVEAIVVSPDTLGNGAAKLGVVELRICRNCGYLFSRDVERAISSVVMFLAEALGANRVWTDLLSLLATLGRTGETGKRAVLARMDQRSGKIARTFAAGHGALRVGAPLARGAALTLALALRHRGGPSPRA